MKTDSEIQSDVIDELKWDSKVTHENIGVSVAGGVVTLYGHVPSYNEKSSAQAAATRVLGVNAVVEEIEVRVSDSSRTEDQGIAAAILEMFRWHVHVPVDSIKVAVERGRVELSGTVDWEYQRKVAERIVRGLSGVVGVINNIKLKSKTIQADVVRQRIQEALIREATLESHRIEVEVQGDKVILSGGVHSNAELQEARRAAWSAPGVATVESKLVIAQ